MARRLPSTFKKMVVTQVTNKFRDAVEIQTASMPRLGPKDVLVKNRFVGVNASDINYTSAKYDPTLKPPFDCGFEGLGEIVSVGDKCKRAKVGQSVLYMNGNSYAEYTVLDERRTLPVPSIKAEYVPLLVSGLTAAISMDKVGEMKSGETVLVTAAAGGTGQFAVQLAKNAGCHVIGTCSSEEKVEYLKKLGCDRPINYSKENLPDVIRKEYKNKLDVVYETIGGDVFDICLNNLAVKGRLIIIGYITGYQSSTGYVPSRTLATLPARLLPKSASVRGFFLNNYLADFQEYMSKMITELAAGRITSTVDNGVNSQTGPFVGLEGIYDAVEYLYSKKSIGKIIVEFPEGTSSRL